MSELFELCMLLLFGVSWPITIYKSVTSRTARGKSTAFTYLVWLGYLCGIVSKLVSGHVTYVIIFYIINLCAVSVDICFNIRNLRLDRLVSRAAEEERAV